MSSQETEPVAGGAEVAAEEEAKTARESAAAEAAGQWCQARSA